MRLLSALLLSLFAGVVSSIGAPGLPKCAGSCVTNLGSCKLDQITCICTNKSLLSGIACCISKNCDAADQKKAIQVAHAICAGQTSDLPAAATCASTGTATATAASTASSSSATSSSGAANTAGMAGAGLGLLVAGLVAAL